MIAIKMIPCYGLLAFVGAFCIQFSMGKLDEKFIQFPIEDSKWNHLTSNDIKDLIIENFDDDWSLTNKIQDAVATIVPVNNTADHPLNKFVGGKIAFILRSYAFTILVFLSIFGKNLLFQHEYLFQHRTLKQ